MIENGGNIFRHTIFQGVNYELRNTIKDNTIGGSGNEWFFLMFSGENFNIKS